MRGNNKYYEGEEEDTEKFKQCVCTSVCVCVCLSYLILLFFIFCFVLCHSPLKTAVLEMLRSSSDIVCFFVMVSKMGCLVGYLPVTTTAATTTSAATMTTTHSLNELLLCGGISLTLRTSEYI